MAIRNGEKYNSHALDEHEQEHTNDKLIEMKRVFKEKEEKLISELQDAKDQAELLEFRVLELEEEQEKVSNLYYIDYTKSTYTMTLCLFDYQLIFILFCFIAKTSTREHNRHEF